MPAIRTQIYLTAEQRRLLKAAMKRERKPMAAIIREAIDAYVSPAGEDVDEVLRQTFGAIPDMTVPGREEWDRFPSGSGR